VKPYHILLAKKIPEGSSVLVWPVIVFLHGNTTTEVKVFEATRAVEEGGKEIGMVVKCWTGVEWQVGVCEGED
jgi:deoxyribose-phosphate aldolase